jgi:biopolymer transport protein ExbD
MRFKKYAQYLYGDRMASMVPLANIIFLIFIFSGLSLGLITAGFGINVRLPRAISSEVVRGPVVQITVMADGGLLLNGQKIAFDDLGIFLKNISSRPVTVVVNADKTVPWEQVARVWDAVRESGLGSSMIATQP